MGADIVLGAGLCGLLCARAIGKQALLLEREREVGGLARSFLRQGFVFDMTGHWLHGEGIARLAGDDLVSHTRRAAVYAGGITTPYPYQTNTYGRPPALVAELLLGYFEAREAKPRKEETFEDHIQGRFGEGFARHFFRPYNEKLWTVPPAEMDGDWCARFLPSPTPREVLLGALESSAEAPVGYNARFWYPRRGGIGQIAERLRAKLEGPVRLEAEVARIDWRRARVTLHTGEDISYRKLVSTMPLAELMARLWDPPEVVREATAKLRAASVTYWDVGLSSPNAPRDAHWTYYPDFELPFYRVGSPSAVMPELAPPGCRSLYVEVSHRRGTPVPVTDEAVLSGLRKVGLLGAREEPLLLTRTTIDCAYVILDRTGRAAAKLILDWLKQNAIISVGRYGAWTYDAMIDTLAHAEKAARFLRGA